MVPDSGHTCEPVVCRRQSLLTSRALCERSEDSPAFELRVQSLEHGRLAPFFALFVLVCGYSIFSVDVGSGMQRKCNPDRSFLGKASVDHCLIAGRSPF